MYRITANVDYVMGHLRYGHYELEIKKEEWDEISDDEKEDYIRECGDFIVDDWSVEDIGEIENITLKEI